MFIADHSFRKMVISTSQLHYFMLLLPLPHQTSLSIATDCNRLQPIGMHGVSPNFGANGSNTSNTSGPASEQEGKSVSVVTRSLSAGVATNGKY